MKKNCIKCEREPAFEKKRLRYSECAREGIDNEQRIGEKKKYGNDDGGKMPRKHYEKKSKRHTHTQTDTSTNTNQRSLKTICC